MAETVLTWMCVRFSALALLLFTDAIAKTNR